MLAKPPASSLLLSRIALSVCCAAAFLLGGCSPAASSSTARSSPSTPASSAADAHTTKPVRTNNTDKTTSPTAGAPAPATPAESTMQTATFGAGCFWGVEYIFQKIPGVTATACGYAGGRTKNPTYKDVCYNETGHAEVVQVTFDPSKVTYEELLSVFFRLHDPTQVDRQGPDVGDQYRSVIFTHTDAQHAAAKRKISDLIAKKKFSLPIATQVVPFDTFYRAEDYHQDYYTKKGGTPYCHFLRPEE